MTETHSDHVHAWMLDLPPTALQKRLGLGLVAATTVAFLAVVPVADQPLIEINALFPSLDAIVFITAIITAALLFSQFFLSGALPLLALGSGYLFTALIVVPHALTFAGAFSPTGLLGAGIQTGSWLFIFWHLGFALGLLSYASLRLCKRTSPISKRLIPAAIWSVAAVSLILVCVLTWFSTLGQSALPTLILSNGHLGPNVAIIILCLIVVCAVATILLLLNQHRSGLDHWLIVVTVILIGELAFSGLVPSVRFSAGFYAGRAFSLITSSLVLIVLLAETTRLYAEVVRSNATLQRERDNKLINIEAMTASIAHEVRQPLTGISTSAAAALNWLKRTPPNIGEARIALNAVIAGSERAEAVFSNIRTLFGRTELLVERVDLNALVSVVVGTMDAEFKQHNIGIETDLSWPLTPVLGHSSQLQEVMSNLLNNAIEALEGVSKPRVVRITTRVGSEGRVMITVEDTGCGLDDPEMIQSIFEPFVTTKRRGMGLGLAISQMIIQRHGGELSARPAKARGTVLQIALPSGKMT